MTSSARAAWACFLSAAFSPPVSSGLKSLRRNFLPSVTQYGLDSFLARLARSFRFMCRPPAHVGPRSGPVKHYILSPTCARHQRHSAVSEPARRAAPEPVIAPPHQAKGTRHHVAALQSSAGRPARQDRHRAPARGGALWTAGGQTPLSVARPRTPLVPRPCPEVSVTDLQGQRWHDLFPAGVILRPAYPSEPSLDRGQCRGRRGGRKSYGERTPQCRSSSSVPPAAK